MYGDEGARDLQSQLEKLQEKSMTKPYIGIDTNVYPAYANKQIYWPNAKYYEHEIYPLDSDIKEYLNQDQFHVNSVSAPVLLEEHSDSVNISDMQHFPAVKSSAFSMTENVSELSLNPVTPSLNPNIGERNKAIVKSTPEATRQTGSSFSTSQSVCKAFVQTF